jgi:hypothetical protein
MDIALNSFILFLLFIFPGIVFRRFYYVGEFSKQYSTANWVNTIYISLIPGLVIQIISYFAFVNLIYREPIPNYYNFINGVYQKLKHDSIPEEIFNFELISWVFAYLLLTLFISFIIAQICWTIVRNLDLDKNISTLKFNNYWHYYLSGESLKFKDFKGILPNQKVLLTEADVLVDTGNDGTKLYKGFIRQHTICKNTGDLKAIYLTDVRRFRKEKPFIKDVPGHIMVIPAEKIINLNLTYITKSENKINYINFIFALLNLLVLLFLMFNPSELILRNTTIFGDIIGRFWLFLDWLLFVALIETVIGSKNPKQLKESIIGLLLFIVIISLIVYHYFYK